MVNFLGPGAFGCARPSASRPTFTADNAPGDVDDWAKDCTDPLARDGTEWRAPFLNFLIANFRELVAASGVPADNRDDAIFARAIQAGGMNHAVATGTANNWAVNPSLSLPAYRAGLVLWLKAPATNTATEVSATLGVPGAVRIKRRDGTDPRIGDLVAGCWYPTFFDGTSLIIVAPLPSEMAASGAPGAYDTIFTTSQTLNIPIGITRVYLEVRAAGGGGGYGNGSGGAGGGGGGGGYAAGLYAVPSGGQLTLTIGAGGLGGTSSSQPGGTGGTASVAIVGGATLLSATGGEGGQPGPAAATGRGGTGGVGSAGQLNVAAQYGQGSIKFSGVDLVGGGGQGAFGGGAGAPQHNSSSLPGTFPGGGGSGGYAVSNGGAGAGGLIRVRW